MSDDRTGTPKDSHYARLRRQHRDQTAGAKPSEARQRARPAVPRSGDMPEGVIHLYGIHTVREAIGNARRRIRSMKITRNALDRLGIGDVAALPFPVDIVEPRDIDRITGSDAVHQGVLLEAEPLTPKRLPDLGDSDLILVLDQVTDPHNVGAILRSAVAFGAGALVTTSRHSPTESGVLAKAASGALEHIDMIEVRNLADALGTLAELGYQTVGLDSEGPAEIESSLRPGKIALVLGAEGKGLRQKTRETVDVLARLEMPGIIRSLNVSNAAAVALYAVRKHLRG